MLLLKDALTYLKTLPRACHTNMCAFALLPGTGTPRMRWSLSREELWVRFGHRAILDSSKWRNVFLCMRPSTWRWYDARSVHFQWSALKHLVRTSEESFCISDIEVSLRSNMHHTILLLTVLVACSSSSPVPQLGFFAELNVMALDFMTRLRSLSPVASTCVEYYNIIITLR